MRRPDPLVVCVAARAALAGAAWLAAGPGAFLTLDSPRYLELATSLTGGAFAAADGTAEVFRTPGYPLLLAVGVAAGWPLVTAIVLQIALAAVVTGLTHWTVRQIADERAGAIAALAVALEPTFLLWSLKIMPEALFTACVTASLAALVRYWTTSSWRWAAAAALALSVSAYVRPITYPLAVTVAAAALAFVVVRRQSSARNHALVAVAMIAMALVPWHARNARAAGYAGFSSVVDHALYLSVAGGIEAQARRVPYLVIRRERLDRLQSGDARSDAGDPLAFHDMRREGVAAMVGNVPSFAGVYAAGLARTLLDPGSVEYARLLGQYPASGGLLGRAVDGSVASAALFLLRERPILAAASVLLGCVTLSYLVAAVVGVRGLRTVRQRRSYFTAAACAGCLLGLSGGVVGYSRFRAPAAPLLVVMACCGSSQEKRWR